MAQSNPYGDRDPQNLKEKASESVGRMADKAAEQTKQMAGSAESAAGRIAEQGREAGERVQEVAANLKGAVDKSVKDQPMATVALVAVAGFVLGALWRR